MIISSVKKISRRLLIFNERFLLPRNYGSYLLNRNRGLKGTAAGLTFARSACTLKPNSLYERSISYHSSSIFHVRYIISTLFLDVPFNVEKSFENQQIRAVLSEFRAQKIFISALVSFGVHSYVHYKFPSLIYCIIDWCINASRKEKHLKVTLKNLNKQRKSLSIVFRNNLLIFSHRYIKKLIDPIKCWTWVIRSTNFSSWFLYKQKQSFIANTSFPHFSS